MLLSLLLWLRPAGAFTLEGADAITLGEPATALAPAVRPEGTRLVGSGSTTGWVLDGDGAGIGSIDPAQALLATDLDADGFDDLVSCSASGLGLALWSASVPEGTSDVDATACAALLDEAVDGTPGVIVASSDSVTLYAVTGSSLTGPTATGLAVGDQPRLAASDAAIAAGTVGESELGELGTRGVSSLALGGSLADVVDVDGDWLVALSDAQVLRNLNGADTALAAEPLRLSWADLDVDGLDDLVVLETDRVEVFPGDGTAVVSAMLAGPATVLAAIDLTGDGCPDLALARSDVAQLDVLRTGHCPLAVDGDGDGVSAGDGDCDDGDPSRHPGAGDACDTVDNDCDGETDEPGTPAITRMDEVPEGDENLIWASTDGCDPDLTWVWTDPSGPLASCGVAGAEVDCIALDDGDLALHVEALDADGALVAALDDALPIRNVAPSMTLPAFLADGELELIVGEDAWVGALTATDPGADTPTFSASGGPDFFQVSPTGSVVINPREVGAWTVTLAVADEDGGRTTADIAFRVVAGDTGDTGPWDTSAYDGDVTYSEGCSADPAPSTCSGPSLACGGGGCCGSPMALFVGLAWGLRRRRAPGQR